MHTKKTFRNRGALGRLAGLVAAALLLPVAGWAAIPEPVLTGLTIDLTAREGYVSTPDGASIYSWGYAPPGGVMQYPGPTIVLNQGDVVTVTLTNALPAAAGNVSIVFPGQNVTASGGVPGLLTAEAPPGGMVSYTFTADRAGTFAYHSGTRPELQVDMGLTGALIVRSDTTLVCSNAPPGVLGGVPPTPEAAYDNLGTCYDREYLFLMSEMDLDLHDAVAEQVGGPGPIQVVTEPYDPEYWFINGRAAPDTMAMAGTATLPHQPYNCMPRMHPGERLLMRLIGGGRQLHAFHFHGNSAREVARDGNLLATAPGPGGALTGALLFTISPPPGGTADAVFDWTGKGLGWDIYGHPEGDLSTCTAPVDGYDPVTGEWCADHGKPLPVELPDGLNLAVGGFWSGGPFMGAPGSVPPGEGGLNPNAGYSYMWHSHVEREMINNDVFPGGLMTMLVIEPPGIGIVE